MPHSSLIPRSAPLWLGLKYGWQAWTDGRALTYTNFPDRAIASKSCLQLAVRIL